MYWPSNILKEMLLNCGYSISDDIAVFSSGEEGVSKHTGELYKLVRDKIKKYLIIRAGSILVIINIQILIKRKKITLTLV